MDNTNSNQEDQETYSEWGRRDKAMSLKSTRWMPDDVAKLRRELKSKRKPKTGQEIIIEKAATIFLFFAIIAMIWWRSQQ